MALKTYNPTTPGQRQLVMVDRSALYKGKPVKALTEGKHSSGGRNNTGRITVRFRGGGHKRTLRTVDFKRDKIDVPATVERLEYDPNRTGFIALIIDGAEIHNGFAAAARNIPNIDVLPIQGINVYDILRRQKLVLTKAAVDALEARCK